MAQGFKTLVKLATNHLCWGFFRLLAVHRRTELHCLVTATADCKAERPWSCPVLSVLTALYGAQYRQFAALGVAIDCAVHSGAQPVVRDSRNMDSGYTAG